MIQVRTVVKHSCIMSGSVHLMAGVDIKVGEIWPLSSVGTGNNVCRNIIKE